MQVLVFGETDSQTDQSFAMDFSQEALNRLYSSISAAALKASPAGSTQASLSPKETELVLEIISEFVFFTKSKSKRLSSVQELQLMQVITDFFQSKAVDIPMDRLTENPTHQAYFSQFAVLNNLFNFLFMEPPTSNRYNMSTYSLLKKGAN